MDHRTILVRPHRLRFADSGAVNAFPVVIAERQYFAHYFEYTCRWRGMEGKAEVPPGKSASPSDGSRDLEFVVYDREQRETGTETYIAFDPEDAVLLP